MAYSIEDKFKKNSPLPCWKGYERVPGTKKGAKGSCRKKKSSPAKVKKVKAKGGGTTKVCLPLSKIRSMSKAEKNKVIRAKRKAGKLVNIKEILKVTLLVLKVKI